MKINDRVELNYPQSRGDYSLSFNGKKGTISHVPPWADNGFWSIQWDDGSHSGEREENLKLIEPETVEEAEPSPIEFADIRVGDTVKSVVTKVTEVQTRAGWRNTITKTVEHTFTVTSRTEFGLYDGRESFSDTIPGTEWFLLDRPIPTPKNGDIFYHDNGDGVEFIYFNGYVIRDPGEGKGVPDNAKIGDSNLTGVQWSYPYTIVSKHLTKKEQ